MFLDCVSLYDFLGLRSIFDIFQNVDYSSTIYLLDLVTESNLTLAEGYMSPEESSLILATSASDLRGNTISKHSNLRAVPSIENVTSLYKPLLQVSAQSAFAPPVIRRIVTDAIVGVRYILHNVAGPELTETSKTILSTTLLHFNPTNAKPILQQIVRIRRIQNGSFVEDDSQYWVNVYYRFRKGVTLQTAQFMINYSLNNTLSEEAVQLSLRTAARREGNVQLWNATVFSAMIIDQRFMSPIYDTIHDKRFYQTAAFLIIIIAATAITCVFSVYRYYLILRRRLVIVGIEDPAIIPVPSAPPTIMLPISYEAIVIREEDIQIVL